MPQQILNEIPTDDVIEKLDVAGPGFINIRLSSKFLAEQVTQSDLVTQTSKPERVVIDYSSPNLAKEMHVGHLRSTIIGDAVARILELAGHQVIRQNHIGDWGTAFGRLLAYIDDLGTDEQALSHELSDLELLYVHASRKYEADPDFAGRARSMVLSLQAQEPEAMRKWEHFLAVSMTHMNEIYKRLKVSLADEHVRGESAYNAVIPDMLEDLTCRGLTEESDGALCIFMDEFKSKENKTLPMMLRKSDGGYLYHTTDLADVRYRQKELLAERMLWFTDSRQKLHFQMLFSAARLAGYVEENTSLEFHPFGSILGEDGKPFKSRSGENIRLNELLNEAIKRAQAVITQRDSTLSKGEVENVINAVAIGAVKYADLSKNRTNDYVFNWDEMLSLEGNTAPYLQYAYARICSVFERAGRDLGSVGGKPNLESDEERLLALTLLQFQETVESVARDAKPHYLCSYLYELAVCFMRFYENCPILNADEDVKEGRLTLSSRTARTLDAGLNALGIEVLQKM